MTMKNLFGGQSQKSFASSLALLLASFLLSGCTSISGDTTVEGTWRFHVLATEPQQYTIRVPKGNDYPVPADGHVKVFIRRGARYSDVKYGDVSMGLSQSTDVPYIYVIKGNLTIKRLSTLKLFEMPTDQDGNIVVKVK